MNYNGIKGFFIFMQSCFNKISIFLDIHRYLKLYQKLRISFQFWRLFQVIRHLICLFDNLVWFCLLDHQPFDPTDQLVFKYLTIQKHPNQIFHIHYYSVQQAVPYTTGAFSCCCLEAIGLELSNEICLQIYGQQGFSGISDMVTIYTV